MLKLICFFMIFAIATNVVNALFFTKQKPLVNRTIIVYSGDFEMNNITTGLKLSKEDNNLKFLWTEEFNNYNNSFKVYVNYFFANSGIREIITIPNACGTYRTDTIQHFLQILVLKGFADTFTCPIKKGATGNFQMPLVYSYMTRNPACGPTYAMYNVFKLNPKKPKITPVLFVATFTAHISGPNCYPKAQYNNFI
ncbi:uncharacterized protein LOC127288362 [Leptopilina boulardi]|uniref:uncharacterized protein LOC127288362 n=1 Tax=Leptopilina boulardi TaxID=63433 RepID=UPI0021F5D568|nr:uncharacterized protein LOC127288362 [Leptopilina boulardi]